MEGARRTYDYRSSDYSCSFYPRKEQRGRVIPPSQIIGMQKTKRIKISLVKKNTKKLVSQLLKRKFLSPRKNT